MLTRRRRRQCLPHWLELEPGVWEKIFCQLDQDSLRGARLVCKAWNDTACRGIKSLRIELRTGPLMLYRTRSTGVPTLIKEVAHLPGHLRFVEQVRVVGAEALQPQVIARMCCFSRLASLHACFGGVVVSNQQMQALCSLTCLGALRLEECNFKDSRSLEGLQGLPQLTALVVNKCHPYDPNHLAAIGKLKGLQLLDICKPFCFKDVGYASLSELTNLRHLHLGWSWKLGSGGERISFLSELRGLETLTITKCFVFDQDLRPITALTALTDLRICLCHHVTGTIFRELTGLTNLRQLSLEGSNMLTDEGVGYLGSLTSLLALHLGSSAHVTTAAIAILAKLHFLAILRVPQVVFDAWPQEMAVQSLRYLQIYQPAPSRPHRELGRMEDRVREMVVNGGLRLPDSGLKILQWFHEREDMY